MRPFPPCRTAAAILLLLVGAGCGGTARVGAGPGTADAAQGGTAQLPTPNPADVHFMSGMIHHHAQALVMAGWAETHGANDQIRILSERILVSQTDEIRMMQQWLGEQGAPVPDATPTGMTMVMGGVEHEMLMPGMLTDEQMAELNGARGPEFDRLFLSYMIQHHEGALEMVETLFSSHGGAMDDFIYKIASDTFADQGSEIDRMWRMLEAMGSPGP